MILIAKLIVIYFRTAFQWELVKGKIIYHSVFYSVVLNENALGTLLFLGYQKNHRT